MHIRCFRPLLKVIPYLAMVVLNLLIWKRVISLVRARTQCGVEAGERI